MNLYFDTILKSKKISDKRYAVTIALVLITAVFSLALMYSGDILWSLIMPHFTALRDSIDPNPDTNIDISEALSMAYNIVMTFVYVLLPALLLHIMRGRSPATVLTSPKKTPGYSFIPYLLFAIGAGYIASAISSIVFSWTDVFTTAQENLPTTTWGIVLYFVFSAVLPAICEEYLFRGVILGALLPYGKTQAIVISSIVFGLMHVNPVQALFATVIGLILGKLYVDTGSIWWGSIIHFSINGVATFFNYVATDNTDNWSIMIIIGLYSSAIMIFALIYGIMFIVGNVKESRKPDFAGGVTPEKRTLGEAFNTIFTRSVWATSLFVAMYTFSLVYRYFS